MKAYQEYSKQELQTLKAELENQFQEVCTRGLKLDMSRGKPSTEQIRLSAPMLNLLQDFNELVANGVDCSNYGLLEGIPAARALMGELLDLPPENVFVGGNSSLNLMHDCVSMLTLHGAPGCEPWGKQEVKFLCPSPGYDRHFAISEHFGFSLVAVEMDEHGPVMDQVEALVQDPTVKGIWCVPKYSNPTGITYSDEVVRRMAAMKPAAPDFRIFWDNAYVVHDLDIENPDNLLNIMDLLLETGDQDRILSFASTSKITFPGGGISAIGASSANIAWLRGHLAMQTISYDKISQLRHATFLHNKQAIKNHMREHAKHLIPRFDIVCNALSALDGLGISHWQRPHGGYFIALDVVPGCAKRVVELCKQAGVVLTPAGATHPYGRDPKDSTIRIAPTYPPCEELEQAAQLLCLCVRLSSVEKYLAG